MANTNPWHPSEEYQPPVTEVEVLLDELHYYPETRNLEVCIDGLTRHYGETPLAGTLAIASRLLFMANVQTGVEMVGYNGNNRQMDNEFYSGGILAIHGSVRHMTNHQSAFVCMSNGLIGVEWRVNPEAPDSLNAETMQLALDTVMDFRAEHWDKLYGRLPGPLKDVLLETAIRFGKEPIPGTDRRIRRQSFMAGYVYLSNYIGATLDTYEALYGEDPPRPPTMIPAI